MEPMTNSNGDVLANLDDLPYEEDVLKNPFALKSWLRYLEYKQGESPKQRSLLFERALRELPGSYKLWAAYLKERVSLVTGKIVGDPAYEVTNRLFERALVFMHKMPRIWIEYVTFLTDQKIITRTRQTFDRALKSLPITQHDRIWTVYLKWIKETSGIPPITSVRVWKRYLKLEPHDVEDYFDYLIKVGYYDEAAKVLSRALNSDTFQSRKNRSKHELWLQLCDLISTHPEQIKSLKVDPIIRGGLSRFSDQVGKLWTSLAEYYIRLAHFEKARDVFEEAINTVITARDFTHIWEAYTQFEDSIIAAKTELLEKKIEDDEETEEESFELDLMMAQFDHLVERRPLLMNSVHLRQNPHNVHEWHKRVKLYEEMKLPKMVVETYTKALQTVNPMLAKGKPHTLWCAFARYYENHERIEEARTIFSKATEAQFRTIDELASVWCEFVELELRQKNFDQALEILRRATISPKRMIEIPDTEPVQKRVYKSTKLWSIFADLEESLGTFATTKAVYDRMIELKIITPQIILNYAAWLEENHHFEDAFKAYEKGISLFQFPQAQDIWVVYLDRFIKRFGGAKIERARDLFEQVLKQVPATTAKVFYIMYSNLEENYGLARHSMNILERGCNAKGIPVEDKFALYLYYIDKATQFFGVIHTRDIYSKAIDMLPDKYSRELCLRFAILERQLGEIDRARGIYIHCAQMCDPRTFATFWETWSIFEKKHGNEDTYREMLRVKRSVQALYGSQFNALVAGETPNVASLKSGNTKKGNSMEALEKRAIASLPSDVSVQDIRSAVAPGADKLVLAGVSGSNQERGSGVVATGIAKVPRTIAEMEQEADTWRNTEEINILMPGDADEALPEDQVQIEEVSVPNAVFGAALEKSKEEKTNQEKGKEEKTNQESESLGAMERFKRKRQ